MFYGTGLKFETVIANGKDKRKTGKDCGKPCRGSEVRAGDLYDCGRDG
jgi:hypothetical protein